MAAHPEAPEQTQTTASPLDGHVTDNAAPAGRHDGRATASLVVSIVGVVAGIFIPIIGLILGIVGTVLGAIAKRDSARGGRTGLGQAKAGFIVGIIAIAIAILSWIAAVA